MANVWQHSVSMRHERAMIGKARENAHCRHPRGAARPQIMQAIAHHHSARRRNTTSLCDMGAHGWVRFRTMATVAPDDFGKIGADIMCRQMGLGLVLLPIGRHSQDVARLPQAREQRR
jgi:hypothetical protein